MTDTNTNYLTDEQEIGVFQRHLYRAAAVDDPADPSAKAEALCSGVGERFGPFRPVDAQLYGRAFDTDAAGEDICQNCLAVARREAGEAAVDSNDDSGSGSGSGSDTETTYAPFDPGEYTVEEIKTKLGSADAYSDDELAALLDAEYEGKDRITALEAIRKHLPDERIDEPIDA